MSSLVATLSSNPALHVSIAIDDLNLLDSMTFDTVSFEELLGTAMRSTRRTNPISLNSNFASMTLDTVPVQFHA